MKNQTKRVEDALEQNKSNRKKSQRANKQADKKTPQEIEQAAIRKMMRVDHNVWDIINRMKMENAKHEYETYGDPLESDYRTESARIKDYSEKFRNMSVAESFAAVYNVGKLDPEIGNELPEQLSIGSVVELRIQSISKKGGVVFDSGVYKETFITRNNLASFERFEGFMPKGKVRAKVVDINRYGVVVDIFEQLADEFIIPRAKEPWTQNLLSGYVPVRVKDLRLVRGGYLGKAVIPTVSAFVGVDMVVDAFIPGSQIVQNTTDNFEQFEGAEVETFINAWSPKPRGGGMSLICSAKNLIKHRGHLRLKTLHSMWCDQSEDWDKTTKVKFDGRVTGVINSSKKCGVFVEIPALDITGMVKCKPEELVNYKAGDEVAVHLKDFDEELRYQEGVDQFQHIPAFEIERGAIKRVNVKPIFAIA